MCKKGASIFPGPNWNNCLRFPWKNNNFFPVLILLFHLSVSTIWHSQQAINLGWQSRSSTEFRNAKTQAAINQGWQSPSSALLGMENPSSTQSATAKPQQQLIWEDKAPEANNLGQQSLNSAQSGMRKP